MNEYIHEKIQTAKRNKADLHVAWLDIANAYGSVLHQVVTYALDFFYVAPCIQNYFNNINCMFDTQLERSQQDGTSSRRE